MRDRGQRLFREQPAGDLCAARVRHPQSDAASRAMTTIAGASPPATARAGNASDRRRDRRFFDYLARGAPFGPDDGTLSPWAAIASLPFAPEIVSAGAASHFHDIDLTNGNPYGFTASFNPTLEAADARACGWTCADHVGINQGPIAADDRKPPHRLHLEADAGLSLYRGWTEKGRVHRRMAVRGGAWTPVQAELDISSRSRSWRANAPGEHPTRRRNAVLKALADS